MFTRAQFNASHREAGLFSHSTIVCHYIRREYECTPWYESLCCQLDAERRIGRRKEKIKIKAVIIQQHGPCWNIVRADLGGMPTIAPSEHPGGGMS